MCLEFAVIAKGYTGICAVRKWQEVVVAVGFRSVYRSYKGRTV